ncbi:NAC domain-containing protein 104-like [Aristolochia californica]|uniref:NAC domain-containing protein 104-like n=1 Tax=Aristolochia californica TaxID=171875 RepID=UPI0035E19233
MGDDNVNLPPGFRFYPTDQELVVHFLYRKAARLPCHPVFIPDLNMDMFDPWDLEGKVLAADNQWYFFSHISDSHTSPNGYWKTMGADEPVSCDNNQVGVKKSLAFYIGEHPMGTKTNWVMHEYHLLDGGSSSRSSRKRGTRKSAFREWVLCRVYDRSNGGGDSAGFYDDEAELSCLDEVFLSLDDLDEISLPN